MICGTVMVMSPMVDGKWYGMVEITAINNLQYVPIRGIENARNSVWLENEDHVQQNHPLLSYYSYPPLFTMAMQAGKNASSILLNPIKFNHEQLE